MNAVASNSDAMFIKKFGINFLLNKHNASPFTKDLTIRDYLWNLTSPVLESGSKIPTMVPTLNAGILQNVR